MTKFRSSARKKTSKSKAFIFRSALSRVALGALCYDNRNWPVHLPYDIDSRLNHLRRESVAQWAGAAAPDSSLARWCARAEHCCSCLIWQPRPGHTFRHCGESWLCPWCYGRALVQFLRPFRRRTFGTSMSQRLLRSADMDEVWAQNNATAADFVERTGGVAHWHMIYPTPDGWQNRAVWLYPGTHTFAESYDMLVSALAYPLNMLDASADQIQAFLDFQAHHRGRTMRGVFHRKYKHRDPTDRDYRAEPGDHSAAAG